MLTAADTGQIRDSARGLAYLHSRNVCHGDLKAANVLVHDDLRALLCDFGQACMLEDEEFRSLVTGDGFKGSVNCTRFVQQFASSAYALISGCSPEVVDNCPRTIQSDMWSFGWLIYEVSFSTPHGVWTSLTRLERRYSLVNTRSKILAIQPRSYFASPQCSFLASMISLHAPENLAYLGFWSHVGCITRTSELPFRRY